MNGVSNGANGSGANGSGGHQNGDSNLTDDNMNNGNDMSDIYNESMKPKRKKTSRACNHCQKSHMTCDSNRPCNRCIQRGLSATCEDAPRKRKKYLEDVPMDALSRPLYRSVSNDVGYQQTELVSEPLSQRSQTAPYVKPEYNALLNTDYLSYNNESDNTNNNNDLLRKRSKFLSSAADLEYATLSNIISDNFLNPSTSNENTPNSLTLSPALSPHVQQHQSEIASPGSAINDAFIMTNGPQKNFTNYNVSSNSGLEKVGFSKAYDSGNRWDENINQYFLGSDNDKVVLFPDLLEQLEAFKKSDPNAYYEKNKQSEISCALGILSDDSPITRISELQNDLKHYFKEPEDIYEKVSKPYSYTPGYHSLIAYLRKRFNKEMLVKMAETMASYRPSFIACTNSLKEHDLIFMEQCFQRTLLTYDSIIKVSGTPTIVWRRTGEIAYVGNEFCILTGWTKEELLSHRKTFIVELLDDKSVLEYFQLFSKIAFGDFFGATMSECTLLSRKPDVKIRTRCSWTLKRDVFGIPMMIIGNFLPILC